MATPPPIELSAAERAQLGTGRNDIPYFRTPAEWDKFRAGLVEKSAKRNPGFFDPSLAAYTPGETEALLQHPQIMEWHARIKKFRVPAGYDGIVLVPCAASKPWRNHANLRKSKLYKAYNEIIRRMDAGELSKLYFMTVSEPLGIVPQDLWHDFPAYDNPGLFKDDFLRTGMVKTDWTQSDWGQKFRLPFDEAAYTRCIAHLGEVIRTVLVNNPLPVIALVDDPAVATTHGAMLDVATQGTQPATIAERHPKRTVPRVDPTEDLAKLLANFPPRPRRPRPR